MTCTLESHDALRADVGAFHSGTTFLGEANGLHYRNCTSCRSTLTLPVCRFCGMCCPTGDRLELPTKAGVDDDHAHFRCWVNRLLERGAARFVAVRWFGRARELAAAIRSGARS